MAASPQFKLYDEHNKYQGCMKYAEDAAIVISSWRQGTIRWQHALVVWREGKELQPAAESYDYVAQTIEKRIRNHNAKIRDKMNMSIPVEQQ